MSPQVLPDPVNETSGATVELAPLLRSGEATDSAADAGPATVMEVGRVLRGRYVIQERLGSGGRGTVFRALDLYRASLPAAEQQVAMKVLHAARGCSEQTINDLQRELHCGQALSHPNIVNVYELDRDGDIVFFTMELLEGNLLSEVLCRMRPAVMLHRQAVQLIRQLGAGLAHAHERGVVHGDLKPQNLLVTSEGQLRILDFGAAQTVARTPSGERPPTSGTPAYASCEMLEGRPADACDDLYALACICYELLGGGHPFAGRPATIARDFGVKAVRPAGLTGRQWRTLQRGLSWHRAGRSMGVHAFTRKLTRRIGEKPARTPLKDLSVAGSARPLREARVAAVAIAVLLAAVAGIAHLRRTSAGESLVEAAATPSMDSVATPSPVAAPVVDPAKSDAAARIGGFPAPGNAATPVNRTARHSRSVISVDGYQVSMGDRFVEIRVHRDRVRENPSFAWWTEPATAKQNVDYVHQPKAIQTFAPQQRSTRFYVKLLREPGRSQRNFFYVAIAEPGYARDFEKVKRVQIWLPTPRDLQASR